MLFLGLILFYVLHISRRDEKILQTRMKHPELIFSHVIVGHSNTILGAYQGKPIYETITIADGRTFTFESVAVPYQDGVYLADYPECWYILIDGKLLYREELDK